MKTILKKVAFDFEAPAIYKGEDVEVHLAGTAIVRYEPNEYCDIDGNRGIEAYYVEDVRFDICNVINWDGPESIITPVKFEELGNQDQLNQRIDEKCVIEFVR